VMLLLVMGAGGFGMEAIWVAEEMNRNLSDKNKFKILGYIDDYPEKKGKIFYGYSVLGLPEQIAQELKGEIYFHCAIGDNKSRENVANRLAGFGWRPITLIHPSALMGREVSIGDGSYIGAGAVVAPRAKIGNHVLINCSAGIGHDSVLEDFAQVCPGARVNGMCTVKKYAFIGSNASLHPGITVGTAATVGANSQVIRSVRPNTTVIGVPAKTFGKSC